MVDHYKDTLDQDRYEMSEDCACGHDSADHDGFGLSMDSNDPFLWTYCEWKRYGCECKQFCPKGE